MSKKTTQRANTRNMNKKTATRKTKTAVKKVQKKDVKLLTTSKNKVQKTETTSVRSAKNRRTIVDVCIVIFTKNENKPMYVKNIYSAMRQRHWKTEGKTPEQTISSKLNRDYRFVRVSPNTFKMSDDFYKNRVRNLKA